MILDASIEKYVSIIFSFRIKKIEKSTIKADNYRYVLFKLTTIKNIKIKHYGLFNATACLLFKLESSLFMFIHLFRLEQPNCYFVRIIVTVQPFR